MWIDFKKDNNVVKDFVKTKVTINGGQRIEVAQKEASLQGIRLCKRIEKSYLNGSICNYVTASNFIPYI